MLFSISSAMPCLHMVQRPNRKREYNTIIPRPLQSRFALLYNRTKHRYGIIYTMRTKDRCRNCGRRRHRHVVMARRRLSLRSLLKRPTVVTSNAYDGATYPVRYTYDTAGRRTSLSTTRDGETGDTTIWAYDSATGN